MGKERYRKTGRNRETNQRINYIKNTRQAQCSNTDHNQDGFLQSYSNSTDYLESNSDDGGYNSSSGAKGNEKSSSYIVNIFATIGVLLAIFVAIAGLFYKIGLFQASTDKEISQLSDGLKENKNIIENNQRQNEDRFMKIDHKIYNLRESQLKDIQSLEIKLKDDLYKINTHTSIEPMIDNKNNNATIPSH